MAAESLVLPKHHRNSRNGNEKQMLQETVDAVTTELKRFAQQLNLSESQKEQLKTYLAAKHAELEKYRGEHPNLSRGELVQRIGAARGSLREQVVKFLTPEQLQKWDAEVSKATEFLGHKLHIA
jgi:hypothetical protein